MKASSGVNPTFQGQVSIVLLGGLVSFDLRMYDFKRFKVTTFGAVSGSDHKACLPQRRATPRGLPLGSTLTLEPTTQSLKGAAVGLEVESGAALAAIHIGARDRCGIPLHRQSLVVAGIGSHAAFTA